MNCESKCDLYSLYISLSISFYEQRFFDKIVHFCNADCNCL